MMHKSALITVVILLILACRPVFAQASDTRSARELAPNIFAAKTTARKIVKISPQMIPVCYNFGCRVKEYVSLSHDEWASVEVIFKPQTSSPEVERIRVGKAIAQMERLVGNHTPIHRDVGLNLSEGAEFPGQLDCIDESINTTTFLHILQRYDLIKHHKVIKRAYRRAAFDQHWTGQLQELKTDDRYVVDTWFYANGEMPVIQPTHEWLDISIFTSYTNNANRSKNPGKVKSLTQKVGNKVKSLFN